MHTHTVFHGLSGPPAMRVVMMPGAYQQPAQFLQAGFDQAVLTRAPRVELILTMPELAHLTDRRWLATMHEQIVAPARSERDVPLWLGGVSLGAFMALRFAAQYPESIDGLCLLAPYLGSRIIAAEIAAHANIAHWQTGALDEDDDERRIWQYVARLQNSPTSTRVFVGFGSSDRFADTQRVLVRALASVPSTTRVVAGGHDWPVWRELWDQFLDVYGKLA
jgi:pimeloyl-ACP methyl ester carboxylesterase